MTQAWDREKVPDRNRTHDLPNTWRTLSGGHVFDSCRGLRFPTLMSYFITELKVHHLYSLITVLMLFTILYLGQNMLLLVAWFQSYFKCYIPEPSSDHRKLWNILC